ncbi:MAG TPA: apolipoprotein N-acyltransferase [Moraxellaceae bacterium]|nr:apolipoprotein N-acyltransferase [Moraxellaceae bacterium]
MRRFHDLLERLRYHRHLPGLMLALGVLTPFAFSPFDLWPLALIGIGLAGELLRGHSVRRTAFLAWCHGFGLWCFGTYWLYVSIHDYGYTPPWLATPMVAGLAAFMALFFAGMGAIYARLRLARTPLLALPALWVLGEWVRSWFLTGFPWLFTGYAFIDTPLAGYAPVTGVFGVSLIAVFTALALVRTAADRRAWPALTAALALWGLGFILQQVTWTHPTGDSLSVSIVQGNIPQESKWQLEWRDKTVDIYRQLSKTEWGRDLVIWPEAAVPMFFHEARPEMMEMEDNALTGHSAFVTGIPWMEVNEVQRKFWIYNAIYATGEGSGVYFKQRLVPFGEYIPLDAWLRGALPFLDMPMTSFTEGPPDQTPLTVQKMKLGPMICYEIAYPDLVRQIAARSDVLATISNDGWFGATMGPHQHFQMVRMRALENGREVIRATNNGISAIIDTRGHVREEAPQFQRLVLRANVHGYRGLTPFMIVGSVPTLAACALLLVISRRRGRASKPPSTSTPVPTRHAG